MNAKQFRRPLVAIVDDDEFVCRAVRRLLLSRGIAAETFTHSRAFVEALDSDLSFNPRCVILDLHMPGLDGFAVQQHLASTRPDVSVIILSAVGEGPERDRALAAGALAVFPKPLYDDMEAFADAVASAVM